MQYKQVRFISEGYKWINSWIRINEIYAVSSERERMYTLKGQPRYSLAKFLFQDYNKLKCKNK